MVFYRLLGVYLDITDLKLREYQALCKHLTSDSEFRACDTGTLNEHEPKAKCKFSGIGKELQTDILIHHNMNFAFFIL